MRYLIIIVCVLLAGIALMPVAMVVGRRLRWFADNYTKPAEDYEQDIIEAEKKITGKEELTMEDKNGSDVS